jgi:signal transduction histidine kinase/DNA-binding NarL/FixJ family response regulator
MAVLVLCAMGIVALVVLNRPAENAPPAVAHTVAQIQGAVANLEKTNPPPGDIDAIQAEFSEVQKALLLESRRPSPSRNAIRNDNVEHLLSRLSAAVENLRESQHVSAEERARLTSLGADLAVLTSSTKELSQPRHRVRSFLMHSGIVVLALISVAAGMAMVRRISRTIALPVDHFVEIARAITHGYSGRRVSPEAAGHFRLLAEAFNQMVDERQRAEKRLQQAHDSLEFKVHARTAELYRSNKALREESEQRATVERNFQQAQKMDALGKLAGSIAHDFNNLLTVIIGGAECAHQHLAPNHAATRLLQTIQQAAERAAGLTRPLLTFSRSHGLALETVDLNAAAEESSQMLQRLIGVNIELRLDLHPGLPPVKANSNQIQQVIMNLAVNARDAMNGIGHLTISTRPVDLDDAVCARLGIAAAEDWVELAVADTGSGMDESTKARIFEPFFTTKPAGRGTGLGLATVFGIVKQSDGLLDVESALGEGSTFRVFFRSTTAAVAAAASSPASEPAQIGGHGTILLVDDEEDIRELASMTLEAQGYRILSAPNAEEAIVIAEKHAGEIRALITDVVMPGMSGVQLAGVLTQIVPGLRVLFVSGHNNECIPAETRLATQSDYLQKPYRGQALAAKVHEILTASSLRPPGSWLAETLDSTPMESKGLRASSSEVSGRTAP